jgi:predicted ferric reductase
MMLWFANRGTGVVLLALLTLATALGVLSTARASSRWWPRFATQTLHRNVSLLATVLLVVHAATAVIDDFVDLRWYHVVLPVGGEYAAKERLPLTLSAAALVMLTVVVVTSLLRHRLSHRVWRAVHLLTYAAWALGVGHGVLIGTDATTWWGLGVTVTSIVVVAGAAVLRLATARAERRPAETGPMAVLR